MEMTLGVLVEKGVGAGVISKLLGIDVDKAKAEIAEYKRSSSVRALKAGCCATIRSMAKCDEDTAAAIYDVVSAQVFMALPGRRGKSKKSEGGNDTV